MRTLLAVAVLMILPAARAQNTLPACDGDYATVRISTIKPGKLDIFMQAVAEHKAWYRSHGVKDNVIAPARIIERQEGGPGKYSDTEVMTFHIHPPTGRTERDAAYDAFVQKYRDSSDLKSEYRVCLPKLVP